MKTQIWFLAAVAVAVGCGKGGGSYEPKPVKEPAAATVPKGDERNLMPLAVGNQWTYEVQGRALSNGQVVELAGELTWKVVKVETAGGETRAIIDVYSKDKRTDRQGWIVNSKGIYQTYIGLDKVIQFTPPLPSILFPIEKGTKFKWSGSGPRPGTTPGPIKQVSTVLGNQQVDVLEGPALSAIGIETKGDYGKAIGKSQATVFFAPNVGIVRYVHSVDAKSPSQLRLRLKSHRFPNASK